MTIDVAAVAALANLDLSAGEAAALQHDLAAILDYVAQLQKIATDGVEPMSHPLAPEGLAQTPLRADAPRPWFTPAEALANAPAQAGGMFAVPKVISRG